MCMSPSTHTHRHWPPLPSLASQLLHRAPFRQFLLLALFLSLFPPCNLSLLDLALGITPYFKSLIVPLEKGLCCPMPSVSLSSLLNTAETTAAISSIVSYPSVQTLYALEERGEPQVVHAEIWRLPWLCHELHILSLLLIFWPS